MCLLEIDEDEKRLSVDEVTWSADPIVRLSLRLDRGEGVVVFAMGRS